MTRWRLVVLILELALFAIILILPQVDLPDFTFCGGTAPVAARARLSSSSVCRHAGCTAAPASRPNERGSWRDSRCACSPHAGFPSLSAMHSHLLIHSFAF